MLKLISGCYWGADAETLRTTYVSLIRPILEYGYQVYRVASDTNLDKLERVELSGSTPADSVLYDVDLQPLRLRTIPTLTKYLINCLVIIINIALLTVKMLTK
ncbi:hypothetical protein AVEN_124410-1 [Araneus ventricosus]|uniref:Uncharacterized protein n=1 Tax=Araneus ventricosus TaxID=182803 RepID=A0A4Y2UNC1_ARAVE|nr:hypothetical protein AVEN_124410-1 [Araneus ventricosus]